MNWTKLSIFNKPLFRISEMRGEWWIADGQALYADGDVGDKNHEAYVIEDIMRKYAPEEYDKGEYIDWEEFVKNLLAEKSNVPSPKRNKGSKNILVDALHELGMSDEEINIVNFNGDAREYGIRILGWKRVAGNNVETYTFNQDDLNSISSGLSEAYSDEEDGNITFNIEVRSTNTIFQDVPIDLIDKRDINLLSQYRYKYAKDTKYWFLKEALKKQKSIQQIAKEVRAYFVKSYDDEYLKAVCLPVSRKLKEELVKYGYDAIVIQGTFTVDNPDLTASAEWDINDFENEEEMEDATYHPLHYWVEVDNTIVDLTASQFNDELDETMPPIVIGTYTEEPRYIIIHRDWV
jgi:hypothetical protein